ncbi:hypothetical protein IJC60_06085 [bacterium]|nr:hypothetical protein [bacterium]
MKIKAFTLAEAMVMIAVLGIITAVALPTLVKKDFKTDTSVRAASKAYAALAQITSNVIQDGYYYRRFDIDGFGDATQGVDVLTGETFGGAGVNAPEKFKDILLDALYVSNVEEDNDSCVFDTADGVRWKLKWANNTFSSLANPMIVFIDANIKNGDDFECNSLDACRAVDTVAFLIYRNGNVVIDGTETRARVGVNSSGNLANVSTFNDETFVKKILGQHEDTKVISNENYYN